MDADATAPVTYGRTVVPAAPVRTPHDVCADGARPCATRHQDVPG
jgi:hypothetical protein